MAAAILAAGLVAAPALLRHAQGVRRTVPDL
jgi:hypothetical protein